jgi:hypothetical protein
MRKTVLAHTIFLLLSILFLSVAEAGADVTFPGTVPLYQDPTNKTVPVTPPVTAPAPITPPAEPSPVTPPASEPPPESPPPPEPDPLPPPASDPVEQPQR